MSSLYPGLGVLARGMGRLAPAALCLLLLAGCVMQERPVVATEVVAPRRPPPEPFEAVPPPPRPREVVEWRPGHWHWDGRDFDWVPGKWIDKRAASDSWVPGHWAERGPQWVWVEGHWR